MRGLIRGGEINQQANEQTDEHKSTCVLQDFVPIGAAAQRLVMAISLGWEFSEKMFTGLVFGAGKSMGWK